MQPALEGAITEVNKDSSRFRAQKASILSILQDAKKASDEKTIRKEWDSIGSGLRRTLPEREQVR